ncbi:MAG TPA: hypothetical protein VJO12_12080 [Stellaceae bacterium]|nr:hypothetical protein [Stellaceae bacterium]
MSNTLRLTSLARAAALSLALVAPMAVTAYADDEYGTQHETVISQAASSTPSAALSVAQSNALSDAFKVGQNDAFGGSRSSQLAPVTQSYTGRVASNAGAGSGKLDVVGAGGAQDQLGNAIYHPGSGTDW